MKKRMTGWVKGAAENMVSIEKNTHMVGTIGLLLQMLDFLSRPGADDKLGKVQSVREYLDDLNAEVGEFCKNKLAEVAVELEVAKRKA